MSESEQERIEAIKLFDMYSELFTEEEGKAIYGMINKGEYQKAKEVIAQKHTDNLLMSKKKEEAGRKEQAKKREENIGMSLVFLMFFGPAIYALIGAFGHFDSWYYTIFKVITIIEAAILIGTRLNEGKFRNEQLAIGTVFMAILALISVISFASGFDKSFWVVMDIAYAAMQCVIFSGHSKWSRERIIELTGKDPMKEHL